MGHLPGAIHLDRGLIEWRAPEELTETQRTIYIYCRTGASGAFAVQRLTEMGYPRVINLDGGFKAWVTAGYPVYNRHGEFVLVKDGFEKKED